MKTIHNTHYKNHRGGALVFALVTLVIISVIMAIGAKSSVTMTSLMNLELDSKKQDIQIKDHFLNAEQAIVNQVNLWMRVRRICDLARPLDPLDCKNLTDPGEPLEFIPAAYRNPTWIDMVVQAPGQFPSEALNSSYRAVAGERINWKQMCMSNCNTNSSAAYPKRFMIEIETMDLEDPSVSIRASGMIDVDQAALSDFSNLALAISGSYDDLDQSDWPSFPEIPMSAGTHGRIGYFFDNQSLLDFKNDWETAHSGQTFPAELLGVIRFMNPPDQSLSIRKLHTNLPLSNIYYGDDRDPENQIPNGPVTIQDGVLTAASPSSEVNVNFQELTEQPTTIKSQSPEGCNVNAADSWKRPHRAELKMSCNEGSGNCTMSLKEWRYSDAGHSSEIECPALHQGGEIPPNSIYYTSAQTVNVAPSGSGDIVGFGTHNFTIIANGSFEPTHSIENVLTPIVGNPNQGNLAFVSLNEDAIKLKPSFETKLSGHSLEDLYDRTVTPQPSDLTVKLQVAAITAGEKKAPIRIDNSLMGDTYSSKHLGKLSTEGASWGSNPSIFRKLNADGEVVTGFAQVDTNYPEDAIRNPPPGLSIRTSSLHTGTISGFTITREKLANTMAEYGIRWKDD